MKFRSLLAITIVGLLCGCASYYKPQDGAPKAKLISGVDHDSQGYMGVFWTSTSPDLTCNGSDRLISKIGTGDSYKSDAVEIAAGRSFIVSAQFGDARVAQNRECSMTAIFAPAAGRTYRLLLDVRGDVRQCRLGIYDVTEGEAAKTTVPFELPPTACKDGQLLTTNGRPLWINHHYQITTVPARK